MEQLSDSLVRVRFPGVNDVRDLPSSSLERKTWMWSNFKTAWYKVKPSFTRYFFVTIFVATVTTAGQLLTSILAAFAFVFFNFPMKNLIFTLFLATMMVPQQVLLVPNYLILSTLGWIDTFAALIVPWLAHVFGIFMLRQFFMQVPRDLLDAATIDGCSKFGFLFRILIPLSIPPIITIAIFTFLGSWNGLLWPLIVTNSQEMRTIQVGLSYFSQAEGTEWELLMAASTFCIMPLVLAYFFAQKYFVQGEASSGLKG
jgi:multiple sugar transport system permease protein